MHSNCWRKKCFTQRYCGYFFTATLCAVFVFSTCIFLNAAPLLEEEAGSKNSMFVRNGNAQRNGNKHSKKIITEIKPYFLQEGAIDGQALLYADSLKDLVVFRSMVSSIPIYFALPSFLNSNDEDLEVGDISLPTYIISRKNAVFNVWNTVFNSEIFPDNVFLFLETDFLPLSMRSDFISSTENRVIRVRDVLEFGFEVKL